MSEVLILALLNHPINLLIPFLLYVLTTFISSHLFNGLIPPAILFSPFICLYLYLACLPLYQENALENFAHEHLIKDQPINNPGNFFRVHYQVITLFHLYMLFIINVIIILKLSCF